MRHCDPKWLAAYQAAIARRPWWRKLARYTVLGAR